jgi:hypothetical protein
MLLGRWLVDRNTRQRIVFDATSLFRQDSVRAFDFLGLTPTGDGAMVVNPNMRARDRNDRHAVPQEHSFVSIYSGVCNVSDTRVTSGGCQGKICRFAIHCIGQVMIEFDDSELNDIG